MQSIVSEEDEVELAEPDTRHVLEIHDFDPSVKTEDLELLLEKYKDRGFRIKWVDDTTALAIFHNAELGKYS